AAAGAGRRVRGGNGRKRDAQAHSGADSCRRYDGDAAFRQSSSQALPDGRGRHCAAMARAGLYLHLLA
nr:hypothetical protein [Tanacetum cinerariifolium]